MQIGTITVDGRTVGVVSWAEGYSDPFMPDLDGYEPEGRASEPPQGMGETGPHHATHHPHHTGASLEDRARHGRDHVGASLGDRVSHGAHHLAPSEKAPENLGRPVAQASTDTDKAIVEAAKAYHFDPNYMRSIASIESSMNPASNAHNNKTKYKGLYQIGPEEWRRFGQGNIYNARDNAMAAARMWDVQRTMFKKRYGREPTEAEQYMIHQQGLGFFTRGAMTNISGNAYHGMHGPQTHESFEAGWGREIARRKAQFAARHSTQAAAKPIDANDSGSAP